MGKYTISNKDLLKEKYSEEDLFISALTAFCYSLFIYVPVLLMTIQLFYCLISVPYLMVTLCMMLLILFIFIYLSFRVSMLKRIKYVVLMNYNKLVYKPLLVSLPIIIMVYMFVILYIVPKFII